MSKVTAPLLSFGASGQIAKSMVYSTWKGVPYARRHVIPANPRSTEQTHTRDTFSWLNSVWKIAPALFRAPWTLAAKGNPYTDRNLFTKQNLPVLRGNADLTGIVLSPGARGGLSVPVTITPGDDQVTITAVAPDPLPAGWTVTRFIGVAIQDQSPESGALFEITAGEDATDPYSVNLTGLTSAADYWCGGFFEYQKSALATDLAYGSSIGEMTTTT